jgi:dienelactone hydrolase
MLPSRRPSGTVIILQDATGPDGRAASYVDQLLGAGLAVLDIAEHADDVYEVDAVAVALGERIGRRPVGVLSFGAGSPVAAGLGSVTAHALLYPGCGEHLAVAIATTSGPVLLVHGGLDTANPTSVCAATAARLSASGRSVRHLIYEQAGYAWDHPASGLESRFFLPRPGGSGHIQALPWPQLTAMSASQVAGFFSTSLAR